MADFSAYPVHKSAADVFKLSEISLSKNVGVKQPSAVVEFSLTTRKWPFLHMRSEIRLNVALILNQNQKTPTDCGSVYSCVQ